MFEGFFGLSENPFNLTPDPKFLYLSDVHKEALSHLQFGIEQRKGFILITGEVGTGKTTICRSLLALLSKKTRTALILNPSLSDIELLQTINQDFGIDYSSSSKKVLLDRLYDFLIEVFVKGENAVLIIDECQNLTPEVLEQIRLLSNLETEKEKLLQIVMIGQPELIKMLDAPGLRQINDRIVLRYHIWPLNLGDTRNYLQHRLSVAGTFKTDIFTPLAVRSIFHFSHGLPRKTNALAERSLLIAYLRGKRKVGRKIVSSAVKELKGNYGGPGNRSKVLIPLLAGIVAVCALIFLLRPGILPLVAEYVATPVVATPVVTAQGMATGSQAVNGRVDVAPPAARLSHVDYIIRGYDEALELLSLMPNGVLGPDTISLHPEPASLKYVRRPVIASVDNGYVILVYAADDFVRIVGRDKAVVEIPMKEFKTAYKWNIMATYTKSPEEDESFTRGDTGPDVERIQSILLQSGYSVERTGFYDITTACAVEKLQEDFGLKKDGIAAQDTLAVLSLLDKGV